MAHDSAAETVTVTVVAHLPEHGRRRANVPAQAGHCCCCCCCCLHTVGGIVGAIVAPRLGGQPKDAWSHLSLVADWEEEDEPLPSPAAATDWEAITEDAHAARRRTTGQSDADGDHAGIALAKPGFSAVGLFWLTLLGLVPVLVIGTMFVGGGGVGVNLLGAGFILLMCLPVMQLIASVVTCLILFFSSRLDKKYQLRQLGKLTLGMLSGTAFGFAVMLGLVAVFISSSHDRMVLFGWLLFCLFIAGGAWLWVVVLSRQR